MSLAVPVEYPNGLALSPDERTLYIANTRWTQYIHAVELDSTGNMVRRHVFADMSADGTNGVPDGMKVDQAGRVFCTGTNGVWVFAPDGTKIGIIEMPEVCANVAFGGPDLRTLLLTASTSVYTLRVKTPGLPHPFYKRAAAGSAICHCQEANPIEAGSVKVRALRRAPRLLRRHAPCNDYALLTSRTPAPASERIADALGPCGPRHVAAERMNGDQFKRRTRSRAPARCLLGHRCRRTMSSMRGSGQPIHASCHCRATASRTADRDTRHRRDADEQ